MAKRRRVQWGNKDSGDDSGTVCTKFLGSPMLVASTIFTYKPTYQIATEAEPAGAHPDPE